MSTVKLFDLDAFATEFDAKIVSVNGKNIVLDKTLFFPEEGGQTPDTGKINGIDVCDVQIKDEIITHTMKEDVSFKEGDTVHGVIDFNHRFDNMQQHSGEHIFSGLVHNTYGFDNVGFHLSENECTMDFNGELTPEQIEQLELKANEVVSRDINILCEYPSREALAEMDYRSKKEIDGDIRIVSIEGVDRCACCAPHVRTTGQIGLIKIVSYMRHRGGMRLWLAAGFRALRIFRNKMSIIETLVGEFTTSEENIPSQVAKLREENKTLRAKNSELAGELFEKEIENISEKIDDVVLFKKDMDMNGARKAVNMLTEKHRGVCAVFIGSDETGYSFVLGSKNMDCRMIAGSLHTVAGAKCGGTSEMISGKINKDADYINAMLLN